MSDRNESSSISRNGISAVASVGISLAVVISYTAYQSIGWAILHGFLGWFYVIYYAIWK